MVATIQYITKLNNNTSKTNLITQNKPKHEKSTI